jgi:hypothetical protein
VKYVLIGAISTVIYTRKILLTFTLGASIRSKCSMRTCKVSRRTFSLKQTLPECFR